MFPLTKPFKTATTLKITQGFSQEHQAVDFASFRGDWLVAPFNCKIATIRGIQELNDVTDTSFLSGGCGVRMQSIEMPEFSCTYWHCREVFPVKVGDTVLAGQPVAQMGNTGFVLSNGNYVPIELRNNPPYLGTHAHITFVTAEKNLDFSQYIDYTIPVNFDAKQSLQAIINRIISWTK